MKIFCLLARTLVAKIFLTSFTTALTLFVGAPSIVAGPGDLDTTFGTGGKLTMSIGSSASSASAVAVQPDGKIVVVGTSGASNTDFTLVRYNSDGSLDGSFGANGIVITPVGNGNDSAFAVSIQSDGKIIVVGASSNGANDDFGVVRYTPNGSLDTTFDGDGKVVTPVGSGTDQAYAVVVQSDGKIVVAGGSRATPSNNFALVRYNGDGSLDSSFDGDGKVLTAMGSGIDGAQAVALQTDGKIVAAGDGIGSNFDFALIRYNPDGSLDVTFDGDGKVLTAMSTGPDSASGVAIQSDGKIVAVGSSPNGSATNDFAVVRYTTNGSLDTTFNGTGKVLTPVGPSNEEATSVALQKNGKIVVAGGSFNGSTAFEFALVRYNSDGALDTSFDGDGKLTTAIGNSQDFANAITVQPNGRIVAAGYSDDGTKRNFAVSRYIGDSNLKTADFDGDGKSDVSVWREPDGNWYFLRSGNGTFGAVHFGTVNDKIVPGDYDGDGKTDYAVWRPSSGVWYCQESTAGFVAVQFGLSDDLPAQGDYDGDGRTDVAVYRPSTGVWYLLQSTAGFAAVQFGANGDKPVEGDYDGDGKVDVAVYRPSDGNWYQLRSSQGFAAIHFGISADKVVPADFDGDGKTDLGVYRDGTPGVWYLLQSTVGFAAVSFGTTSDIPAAADFDGDGRADICVFRPSSGVWYRLNSANSGFVATQFGLNGDRPVPSGYVPMP